MKAIKTILAIAFTALASTALAQNYMVIQKLDGRNVEIPLSDIDQVYYANYEHEFVDMGLDSGTLWAACNLGANAPYEGGNYYRWGATVPSGPGSGKDWWLMDKSREDLVELGVINADYVLTPEYDAATANWGRDWKMPTEDNWNELFRQCEREEVVVEGMSCIKLTGRNGNTLLIPHAGEYSINQNEIWSYNDPVYLRYWLSEPKNDRNNAMSPSDFNYRDHSYTVRPVVRHVDHQ